MLLGEATAKRAVVRSYLGSDKNDGLGLMFDFEMLNFKFTAEYFRELIRNIEKSFPDPFMPVYVFSNHDRRRSMSRLGNDVRKAKLLHLLQLTVRGVPCMYYGEEIGMTNVKMPFDTARDPIAHKFKSIPRFIPDALGLTINRDEVRTPMQWDASKNAGFSSAEKTWLPVHEEHKQINVQAESADDDSLLHTIRRLLHIRNQEPALQQGSLELLENLPADVLGYRRTDSTQSCTILLNFEDQEKELPLDAAECIFQLTRESQWNSKTLKLSGYGGVILK